MRYTGTILHKNTRIQGGIGGIFDFYEIVPGFGLGLLAIVLFSHVGPGPEPEMVEEFEKVH